MSDQTTDPTLAPLLVLNDTGLYVVELAKDVPAVAMLRAELDAQRQRVASLTAENARLREALWATWIAMENAEAELLGEYSIRYPPDDDSHTSAKWADAMNAARELLKVPHV